METQKLTIWRYDTRIAYYQFLIKVKTLATLSSDTFKTVLNALGETRFMIKARV
jgi:hypothetical protein